MRTKRSERGCRLSKEAARIRAAGVVHPLCLRRRLWRKNPYTLLSCINSRRALWSAPWAQGPMCGWVGGARLLPATEFEEFLIASGSHYCLARAAPTASKKLIRRDGIVRSLSKTTTSVGAVYCAYYYLACFSFCAAVIIAVVSSLAELARASAAPRAR